MRVIYIAGAMRSGTTLLAEYLGSHRGTAAIGEITDLWDALAVDHLCSCGCRAGDCPVWSKVLDSPALIGRNLGEDAAAWRSLLRHRRAWRLARLRGKSEDAWPAIVRDYVGVLRGTVNAFAEATGAQMVVDATKTAPGLVMMTLAFPGRVRVVHLVRDPCGVAYSESRDPRSNGAPEDRPPPRPPLRSALMWDAFNVASLLATRGAGPRVLVGYERLVSEPATALPALAAQLGLSPGDVEWNGNRVTLAPQHTLIGNPNRLAGRERTVRPDDASTRELRRRDEVLVQALTAPVRLLLRRARDSVDGGPTRAR